MTKAIESKCWDEGIPFDAQRSRMRCMPHTVHLAALKVRVFLIQLILPS
jgi:hypothetical protein